MASISFGRIGGESVIVTSVGRGCSGGSSDHCFVEAASGGRVTHRLRDETVLGAASLWRLLYLTSNLQQRGLQGSSVYRIGSPESRPMASRVASRRRMSSCHWDESAELLMFGAVLG
jgi:hypothetical protein